MQKVTNPWKLQFPVPKSEREVSHVHGGEEIISSPGAADCPVWVDPPAKAVLLGDICRALIPPSNSAVPDRIQRILLVTF